MVQDPKNENGPIMQHREPERHEAGDVNGRLPYRGEVIGNKTPPYEVTGVDALSPLLMHVSFPATKEEIIERIGGAQIALDKMRTTSVRDILERTAPNTFSSSTEVQLAVERIWATVIPHPDKRGGHHWQGDDLSERRPN